MLIDAGQEGTGLFIIQDGSVTVEIGGRTIECSAGEFIGELSLLVDGLVHTGRVRAKTTSSAWRSTGSTSTGCCWTNLGSRSTCSRALARRLAETDRMIARG